jgi:hypothetical protein
MDSCVHNQPHGAKEFGGEPAVIRNGILIEAHLFSKLFRVERPAFGVGIEAQPMEAKPREAGELLLHGKLHVVAWNALMVSNGFVVNERTIGKFGGSHYDAARTLAVGSARDIVRCGRGLERRDSLDGYGRLREESEELGKHGFHLSDVVTKVVQDLVRGRGYVFGIGLQ